MMMLSSSLSSTRMNRLLFRKMGTVLENTIRLTFVDSDGNRATVPARVGATLLQAAKYQKVDIEGGCDGGGGPTEVQRTPLWSETTYGEGPSCFHCHVKIPSSFKHLLPVQTIAEIEGLKEFWEEEYSTSSYLGCMITLEKKHDGMVVFVPDAPPVDLV